jgi:4-amino-4-deoxy-L-arabinose transferase-like glycosyltransferase
MGEVSATGAAGLAGHRVVPGCGGPDRLAWAVLAGAAVLALFAAAESREIYGTAGFYAALSRQIADTGGWNPVRHGDVPYVLKPPLQLWLAALAIKALGPTSLAASLWQRLFGLGCIVLTAALGRRLFGPTAGFFAALALLANGSFLENATTFRLESSLLFGSLLSLWAYFTPRGRWRPPVFFLGVLIGLLSKGIAGALPLVLAPLHAAVSGTLLRPGGDARRAWVLWSALLLPGVAWYADQYLRYGDWVVREIGGDSLRAEISGALPRLRHAGYEYGWRALVHFLPFSPLMILGVARAIRETRRGATPAERNLAWLMLLWLALVLAVLVPKGTYRVRYLSPVLPVLTLLAGRELARLTRERVPSAAVRAAGGLVLAAAFILAAFPPGYRREGGAAGISAMKRMLAERLGGPLSPVPSLLPPGEELGPYGRQEGTIDWAYYYLGRPVLAVPLTAEALRGPDEKRLYLVSRSRFSRLQTSPPLRVVAASKFMLLVESPENPTGWSGKAPGGGGR